MATLPSPLEVNLPGRLLARSGLSAQIPGAALRLGEMAYTTDDNRFWIGDESQSPPWTLTSKTLGNIDWTNINPSFKNINVATINGQTPANFVSSNLPPGLTTGGTGGGTTTPTTPAAVAGIIPIGGIIPFAGAASAIPSGFIECAGYVLSRATYPNLWAYVQGSGMLTDDGTWAQNYFGYFSTGNGSTTFRIPDLRGGFVRALDSGRQVDSNRPLGTWQGDQFRSHTHGTDGGGVLMAIYGSGNYPFIAAQYEKIEAYHCVNLTATGGNETRPFNVAYPYIMRYA